MAVSNAQRAVQWLATLEMACQDAAAAGNNPDGEIAASMAQTYALLALRETLVRDNETLCMAVDSVGGQLGTVAKEEADQLGDELRNIVRQLETLTEAVRQVPGAMP